jgi:phospholipid/cholesterol/gamma-HCH transport system substrate-binding protein
MDWKSIKSKLRKEVIVGFLFVFAITILVWGIMYLKGTEMFRNRMIVYSVYDKVNGLVPANPVTINGLKVGQVKSLSFSKKDPRKIIAILYIDNADYPIPVNSVARIYSADLMGSKEIDIVLGDSPVMLKNGDTLKSATEATLGESVNQQLAPLKKKAENLISSIDSLATIMNQVLNQNTRDNLVEAIDHVKQTLENLAHTTQNLDTLMTSERHNLARIIGNVESISANLKQNNDKINNILTNFSDISDSVAKARIPATFSQVNKTLINLDSVIAKINRGDGTVGLLVNDRKLYNEVEKAARDLNLLLEDIKANPKKYVKVSVF